MNGEKIKNNYYEILLVSMRALAAVKEDNGVINNKTILFDMNINHILQNAFIIISVILFAILTVAIIIQQSHKIRRLYL